MSADPTGDILWPVKADAWSSGMGRFAAERGFKTYDSLYAWSIEEPEAFWGAVDDFTAVRWGVRPTSVRRGSGLPGTAWFPGGTLNYAEHALRFGEVQPDTPAVLARSQTRLDQVLTWDELRSAVAACRRGLLNLGVTPGQRVAAYVPNIPEAVVAFLACASIGAIWTVCAPELGVRAVVDRWKQVEPRVLIAVDGYMHGTRRVDRRADVDQILAEVPSVKHLIRISHLGTGEDDWSGLVSTDEPVSLEFDMLPSDHPLFVQFSSGTTGLPKPIVHGHAGVTLEHLKAMVLHLDLTPADRFLWYTTTSWTMWTYLVSALLAGSSIVLFDGDLRFPSLDALWECATGFDATVLGASPAFLMECRRQDIRPRAGQLRWIGSTGAPLPIEASRWVKDVLDVPLHSLAGGTDVCTAFIGPAPLLPVRAGSSSCRHLGCAVEAWDQSGPVPPGERGELVVTAPMPSMPLYFWDDEYGARMYAAYFDTYPGVWRHGDWITIAEDGSCAISGRSDATLNRGGVRLGTSEFYRVVEELPGIESSLVVHLELGEDTGELVLFVELEPGHVLDEPLRSAITTSLRTHLSPRYVPDVIEAVPTIPRTLTGKKLEVPVKRVLEGAPIESVISPGSLQDPASVQWLRARAAS